MATEKFKAPSPYTTKALPAPKEDIRYFEHLEDLNLTGSENKERFGVAVFGVGRIGTMHLANFAGNRRMKILYIIDDDVARLEKVKNYFNLTETKFLTSAEQSKVFMDPKIRFIVCASPTFTHQLIVTEALKNNQAVFCEKPLAESNEKAKMLLDLANKVNQPLMVGFNKRFDESHGTLRNRVRQGEVGKVLSIKVCSRSHPLAPLEYLKASGGIFHDCVIHDIDQIVAIMGEYPTKISALANANIPEIAAINDVDTVAVTMSFASGAVGIIDLSRYSGYGYDQRLEVFGDKGMLRSDVCAPMPTLDKYTHEGIRKSPIYYTFHSRYHEAYRHEIEHFLDVLEGKTALQVDGKDVLAALKIASACDESHRTGKIVELKWTKEELPSTHL